VTTAGEARESTERAARSPWARAFARWGLASRGAMYALVGLLALKVALLGRGQTPDRSSALKAVADEQFGRVLLSAIAVGLAGYALWQLARAVLGGDLEGGKEDESIFKRIGYAGRGVFYAALFVSTLLIVFGADEGGDKNKEDKATAWVLDLPAGPYIVGAVGLAFIGAGLFNVYRGVTRKFREKLKLRKLSEAEDKAYSVIGVTGFVARGVVFGLIGVFLVRAAYQYDPKEAVGIDGALSELAQASYGPILLGLTAAGLFAFGLYSFVEARYREV
jgi:Domain of Unknown Function (DUF1206)